MIKYLQGNLLLDQAEAIINTVNTVGVMGKGLALQFKKAYPDNFKTYKSACDNKTLTTGQVLTVATEALHPPFYIINFPTKAHWRGKSKLEYVEEGLSHLKREVERLKIQSVAIPPLGCGLGGLDWAVVKPMIEEAVADVPEVEWRIYLPR